MPKLTLDIKGRDFENIYIFTLARPDLEWYIEVTTAIDEYLLKGD